MQALTDEVTWIEECYALDGIHEHVSVYLIHDTATDSHVLIDTGSFYHREAITSGVEAATGGAGIDALVLSHSDYPHAANVDAFAAEGSDVELVASSGSPRAQGLPADATKADIGGSLEVCGRTLSFIDPPLADRSHTTWIYDHGSGGLFAADGLGSYHDPGHCDRTASDFPEGIPRDAIHDFHAETLPWLRYVDPDKLRRALQAIVEAYPPAFVAPIHGHPIEADALDRYLDRLIAAAEDIAGGDVAPARAAAEDTAPDDGDGPA